MYRLNEGETAIVNRSQIVTGSQRHRDPRCPLTLRAGSPGLTESSACVSQLCFRHCGYETTLWYGVSPV